MGLVGLGSVLASLSAVAIAVLGDVVVPSEGPEPACGQRDQVVLEAHEADHQGGDR
jgi:hypothetical protein